MAWRFKSDTPHPNTKYTPEIVAALREMKKTRTLKQLSSESGIHHATLTRLFSEI